MNHYHIYEAVGRGKYSAVYKGRKKKTIEYFAIKSVDKSHRKKVLQEVRILHTLNHPNVLKFYSWYETSAHLWLVLEYCVGGDLLTLLQQDGKLPEDSVHDLALGLVLALQYLHSKGIIYCDLKPSNILLDENGHTKLCDFGLARKLSDIAITASPQMSEAKRGSPCYMAPELFKEEGVHSYASDFWALGCVLYECYTGRPPFVEKEFTQLVKSILLDAPSLPGDATEPFVNLINCLLIKDPAERIQWPELLNHAFWRQKFESLPLPPQPAFCSMIERSLKPHLTERNGDGPLCNKTPSKTGRKDVRVAIKHDENSSTGSKGNGTPIKGGNHKSQLRPSRGMCDGKKRDALDNVVGVNLLRLSKIAKTNLQRENEKQNYRKPLPNSFKDDAEVKIANNDMELDFNETMEDDGQEENEGADSSTSLAEDIFPAPNKQEVDLEGKNRVSEMENSNVSEISSLPGSNGGHELSSQLAEPSSAAELANASPQLKTPISKNLSGQVLDFGGSSSFDLSLIMWHPSDLSVKPVMPRRKSDKGSDAMPNLPFHAYSPTDFTKIPRDKLDVLCNKIRSALNGSDNVNKKNVVKYLEMLSSNVDVANILTNGPIMRDLVKMLKQSNPLALRVQLPSVIGLLIRHSTFIEDDLANTGILNALAEGLRDRQELVRRFSMAALGELLFYISTLNDPTRGNPQEPQSEDGCQSSCWQVSNSQISLISSVLRKGEDDLTQLYALRTIENISSHGGYWATRFIGQDLISNLCYIFRAPGKQESLRLTAGSCLVRLLRFMPSYVHQTIDRVPLKDIVSSLFKGNPREQQIFLNLLNMAMLGNSINLGPHLHPLMEDKALSSNLLSLIEKGTEVLRGKTLLFLALLCKIRKRCLSHFFSNARLLTAVDRLAKEKDPYLKNCIDAFVRVVVSTLPGLLETIIVDIQNLNGNRGHAHATPGTRNTQRTSIHFFPVFLHLLGSSLFKHSLVTPQILQLVAVLLKLTEMPFKGRDDFQITLLRVLESITEEANVINNESSIFISQVLPSLVVLYKGNKGGDSRYLCLKIFFDVMAQFLSEPPQDKATQEELKHLSNTQFLPLYPSLIDDEDPIPVHAQKLLVMLIESNHIMVSDLLHLKAVSNCFGALLGDFSTINISNIRLCVALSSASELETKILSKLKVVRKIGNLLEFVHAKEMEDFIEPTLGLCKAFLLRSLTARAPEHLNQPALLYDRPFDGEVDLEKCIGDIADLGTNAGVMLQLSKSPEATVSSIASECLILMLKAAPREATVNILMNLCNVSSVLLDRRGISEMVLERILYAVGFSCRQCLLQSMIVSIQASELAKIDAAVMDLKGCDSKRIVEAASRVAVDLQRMTRR